MKIDPIEVLEASAADARRTASRARHMGRAERAAEFERWALTCEAAIAELRATGIQTGARRERRAA